VSGHTQERWVAEEVRVTAGLEENSYYQINAAACCDPLDRNRPFTIADTFGRNATIPPEEDRANALLLAAALELADALEGLLASSETGSYCEWCRAHAPKNEAGLLVGPLVHAPGCPAVAAHAALVKAGRETRKES